ncbi:hypothetical protein LguiA_024685 [Lonicera macranthoides]
MAKYGEGDKRWIVEDRADGANVHNWHWAETDCLPWSRNLLTKLLSNHTLLSGEGNLFVKTNKVDNVQVYGLTVQELEVKRPNGAAKKDMVVKEEEGKRKEGFKTIKLREKFSCRAKDLYEILMDEKRWKGFTQSNARISKEVGGEFSIFDGSIMGTNVELQEGKLIVQKWRFGSWPDGIQSTVRLAFEEPESGFTIVKLTQTDVPEEDRYGNSTVVENTERGWRDLIFHKIRAVFGFGI